MSILVTGGAGFIGSHFVERLLAAGGDTPILCLDDFNDYYSPARKRANIAGFVGHPRVKIVEQSFCDLDAMRQLFQQRAVRQVVHLGAYAGVRASVLAPAEFSKSNVAGTMALLEAAREFPVERFVLVSSSTVYGREAAVPFQEDAPLGHPLCPYGVTKRTAELLGLMYHELRGVPVVCVRPFSVYGSRIRPDLAMYVFAAAIDRGRPVPLLGDGSMRRDFTHVSDICRGLEAALSVPEVAGQIFNLGHEQPVEIRELVRLLAECMDREAKIELKPEDPADMPVSCADLTKARRMLGYEPRVALADGVRDFVAWFRTQSPRPPQ